LVEVSWLVEVSASVGVSCSVGEAATALGVGVGVGDRLKPGNDPVDPPKVSTRKIPRPRRAAKRMSAPTGR
jgi:hypothetical protein